ncbi:MAG: hypothetical protein A2W25_09560 [candidate division Zixibacteria bacterium RBG_16_53_22]|nr:MAG: hypothetical protein A2W25_09560 [candidate division Zixibacteria bacterium RBG_16_53_22]
MNPDHLKTISWKNPLIYIVALLIILPVFLSDYLPFQDYPDWLYQATALAHYHSGDNAYSQYLTVKPYLVPNSASTIIMALLIIMVNPILAGKLTLVLWLLAMPLCYLYFYKAFQPKGNILQFAPLLLLYNIRFYHGNLSYLLCLPIVFFLLGYYKRRIDNFGWLPMNNMMILLILLFIFHFIGFIICLLGIAVLSVEKFKFHARNHILPAIAIAPSLVLAIIYVTNQTPHGDELAFILKLSLLGKLASIFASWAVAFNFDYEPNSVSILIKGSLNILFVGFILYLVANFVVAALNRNIRWNSIALLGLALIAISLVMPNMFYYITDAGSRLIWIGVLLIMPIFNTDKYAIKRNSVIVFGALLIIITALNSWQIYSKGRQNSKLFEKIDRCLGPKKKPLNIMGDFIYSHHVSTDLFPSKPKDKIIMRIVPGVSSLMRLPYYYYIKYDVPYPHVFQTSMFESKNYRIPLMIKPFPSPQQIFDGIEEYDYSIIVGKKEIIQYFNNYLAPKSTVILSDSICSVLKIL